MALSRIHCDGLRGGDLDGLDLGVRALVADGVHQPRGLEHQQPQLLDARPGTRRSSRGPRPARRAACRRRPARRRARTSARWPARRCRCERMQWWIRPGPSRAWAIAKPSPSSPIRLLAGTRTSVEARSRRGRRGRGRRSRSTVHAAHDRRRRGCRAGRGSSTAGGAGRPSGSVLPITMKISALGVHRAGDPPLAAVDDVVVAVAHDAGARCWWRRRRRRRARSSRTPSGSRRRSSGSSHRSFCSAVPNMRQHLHVAGVRAPRS